MNIKSVINKISDAVSESFYLLKRRRNISKNTVFCTVKNINIPDGFKKINSIVNAHYIITNTSFPEYFIKKMGQTAVVICDFDYTELFGEFQRTMLCADYLICTKKNDEKQLLKRFDIDNIFKGKIIAKYDRNILQYITNGKFDRNSYAKKRKNVIIYSGSLAQNGLTASLINLLANLDSDSDTNYMITYRENSVKEFPERLQKIPSEFRKIPMVGNIRPSVWELICYILYFKLNISWGFVLKHLEILFNREWQRLFGFLDLDTAVQFTGYEYGIIKLFQQFQKNKIIYVHNDMVSEIKYRKNQHLMTLRNAYQKYDNVALVTEDMRKSAMEISDAKGNMKVVPNCHDYKAIMQKSIMTLEFQPETRCNISFNELMNILDSDTEKFITIGRFSPEKAHIRLIDAFGDYCHKYPQKNTCLIIIGGRGELYEKTCEYADKTALNVILIRSMENPMPIMKKCNLFMLPSEYEGLGLVLLEADTLGLPVFATNIPGPAGFLNQHGGTLVENSREGVMSGMKLYSEGKIKPMNIDYEKYNRDAIKHFKEIL